MSAPGAGALWDGDGVRFRLRSRHATGVDVCLFADDGEEARHALHRAGNDLWESYLPGIAPGQLYGYRVDGPWEPANGHYFNPAKLLADPYALAMTGEPTLDEALFAGATDAPDDRDSAPFASRSVVVDPAFDWGDDAPPATPWRNTVIYECHVRGMTRLHPEVPEALRGTYLGLASTPVIEHLRQLGVTAVELLPVHQIASEPHVVRRGLSNYFGYSPLGLLAPHAGYASGARGEQVVEFKRMVRRLHRAGIEVLIDVVLNHTAEGDADGPMLSLRGIDNRAYYRLQASDPSRFEDTTGCGNALDLRSELALSLVVDTLAYWADEMHVDGFRFDLAVTLGREETFEPAGRFFERVKDHPSLARLKLIAEPWDLGRDGYRLGVFPHPWREWNDRCRDAVRGFWNGARRSPAPMHRALAGSREIYPPPRGPLSSIDFVTCHDGFTLEDLVSYERKHNEANGEENLDGPDHNLSRNWGVEGPTDDEEILTVRRRIKRGVLMTLAMSSGVPMLAHGDELGRSQQGNNNAYCHDSDLTWVNWDLDEERRALLRFARRAFALRGAIDPERRPTLYSVDGQQLEDMSRRRLPLLALWRPGPRGGLLILLNGTDRARLFRLPQGLPTGGEPFGVASHGWLVHLTSFESAGEDCEIRPTMRRTVRLPPHASMLLEPRGA